MAPFFSAQEKEGSATVLGRLVSLLLLPSSAIFKWRRSRMGRGEGGERREGASRGATILRLAESPERERERPHTHTHFSNEGNVR